MTKGTGQTKFVRLPALADLELLHATNITHEYPPHIHEQQSIVMVHRGSETTTVRGTSFTALPGMIFTLGPEELHSSRSIHAEYRVFKIHPGEFDRIAGEIPGKSATKPYFPNFLIDDPLVFRSLVNLYSLLERKESLLNQESRLITTMGMLLSRHVNKDPAKEYLGREDRCIEQIRDYLKTRYAENVSLSQLSSLVNWSRFYLLRAFRNKVGVPPHEFQTQVRVAQARKLIRRGTSISDAALQTGYFDQSHLTRHFKRIVGATPGQYWALCNFVQDSRSELPHN